MISCDIQTISYTDCILTILDSNGYPIGEFSLITLKITADYTNQTLTVNDGSSILTINDSQLASINGGAFATLLDLWTYIETQRNLCQCGCGSGGGGNIDSINGDVTPAQLLTVGTSGTDFAITDDGIGGHVFDLPTASATNRGALSTTDWTTFNGKQNALGFTPENVANKTNTVVGNETSTTLYLSVKGYYDYLVGLVWLTAQLLGTWMVGLASKTTPINADSIIISDSSDTDKTKKVSFTDLKAFLKTYFDTIYTTTSAVATQITTALAGYLTSATAAATYQVILTAANFGTFLTGLTAKTTPVDADEMVISDSAGGGVAKKSSFTNIKAFLKTYFDTLYTPIALTTGQIFLGVGGVATASSHARTIINTMPIAVVASSSTLYFLPGSAVAANATESARTFYVNNDGKLERLMVSTATSQSGTGSAVVTYRHSAASTPITTTISAGSAAGRFTDYSNSEACSTGDGISIQVVNNATTNSCTFTQISVNYF
jgi:hypothetical protein